MCRSISDCVSLYEIDDGKVIIYQHLNANNGLLNLLYINIVIVLGICFKGSVAPKWGWGWGGGGLKPSLNSEEGIEPTLILRDLKT